MICQSKPLTKPFKTNRNMKTDTNQNKSIVTNYIEEIWNKQNFEKISEFIGPDFIDNSLPPTLPANVDGLKLWIKGTSSAFNHSTIIEEIVCEDDKVMIKIKMNMKHIGTWRDIQPTGASVFAVGYRYLKFKDGKISENWSLIDGNAIENQLKDSEKGCKIQG